MLWNLQIKHMFLSISFFASVTLIQKQFHLISFVIFIVFFSQRNEENHSLNQIYIPSLISITNLTRKSFHRYQLMFFVIWNTITGNRENNYEKTIKWLQCLFGPLPNIVFSISETFEVKSAWKNCSCNIFLKLLNQQEIIWYLLIKHFEVHNTMVTFIYYCRRKVCTEMVSIAWTYIETVLKTQSIF